MNKVIMLFLIKFLLFSFFLNGSIEDISSGIYYQVGDEVQNQTVQIPVDCHYEIANQQLNQARKTGDIEQARLLSLQINTYWLENRVETFDPAAHGTGESNGNGNGSLMYINNEENSINSPSIPYWFNDVRIDPRDGLRDVSLASLSNGDLYCISPT